MGFLLSLLSGLPGMLGTYFQSKAQTAIAQAQAQADIQISDNQLSTAVVSITSIKFKEWLVGLFFIPFFLTFVDSHWSGFIFTNMHNMPAWYLEECALIFNWLLGVSVGASVVSTIFSHISTYAAQNNQYKAQKPK